MWRKFTVYGLRFSKTSFWNRINTGFLDPAVATVLTACGIETWRYWQFQIAAMPPVATVLTACGIETVEYSIPSIVYVCVATVLTACGIETIWPIDQSSPPRLLQQCLPLAVLKRKISVLKKSRYPSCNSAYRLRYWNYHGVVLLSLDSVVATVLTACGIETWYCCSTLEVVTIVCCNSAYRLRYWNGA